MCEQVFLFMMGDYVLLEHRRTSEKRRVGEEYSSRLQDQICNTDKSFLLYICTRKSRMYFYNLCNSPLPIWPFSISFLTEQGTLCRVHVFLNVKTCQKINNTQTKTCAIELLNFFHQVPYTLIHSQHSTQPFEMEFHAI